MKGDSPLFEIINKDHKHHYLGKSRNSKGAYNTAGSKLVKKVTNIATISVHTLPVKFTPNTVIRNFKDENLITERYFDDNGKPYLDIDYTNHNNSQLHPKIPHQHRFWTDENGNIHRGNQEDI